MSQLLAADDVSDVMAGKVAIVGPGSFSMQNGMLVPRYGMVPGTAIQLLAAETVRQNRMLRDWRVDPPFVLVLVSGLLFFILRRWMPLSLATICMVIWRTSQFSAFAVQPGRVITPPRCVAQMCAHRRAMARTGLGALAQPHRWARFIGHSRAGHFRILTDWSWCHTGTIHVASKREKFIGRGLRERRADAGPEFLAFDAAIGRVALMDRCG